MAHSAAPAAKQDAPPSVIAAKQTASQRMMEEHRRLLYVALTRARDRLYVCGFEGKQGVKAGSWYDLARQAADKVGVEVVPRALDWAAYAQRGDRGEFDAQLSGRLFAPPFLDPFTYYHSSQWAPKGQNNGFYSNREADGVMESARREIDPARRVELMRSVHRLLAADPPGDFLWGADQGWAISKRLDGVEISDFGLFHFLPGPLGLRPAGGKAARAERPTNSAQP